MPFQRKNTWVYPWEQDAQTGNEFIYSIASNSMFYLWFRALNAVSTSGVLIIRFHGKPLGIIGSPRIVHDVWLDWCGVPNVPQHPKINEEMTVLAVSVQPATSHDFCFRTFGVRDRPSSIPKLLRQMAASGEIASVMHYRQIYAVVIPLAVLARFRCEAQQRTAWVNDALAWLASNSSNSFFCY